MGNEEIIKTIKRDICPDVDEFIVHSAISPHMDEAYNQGWTDAIEAAVKRKYEMQHLGYTHDAQVKGIRALTPPEKT